MLVLMTSWLQLGAPGPEYTLLEFFSGSARISRLAKARGHTVMAVDTLYDVTAPPPRTKSKKQKAMYPNSRSCWIRAPHLLKVKLSFLRLPALTTRIAICNGFCYDS